MRKELGGAKISMAQALYRALQIGWRRRLFVLIPFLVSIPLSIIGSDLLPEKYVARTLLFFQASSTNPLQSQSDRTQTPTISIYDEINALLKSAHILDSALKQIMGEEYPKTEKQQALAREELADSLSIRQLGRNFYEFHLKSSDPQGMGEKLEVVMSRFLETLLTSDRAPSTSVQLVLNRRKFEMQQAQKALEEFEGDIGKEQTARNMPIKAGQLKEMVPRLEAKKQELKTVKLTIDKVLRETGEERPNRVDRGWETAAELTSDPSPTHLTQNIKNMFKRLLPVSSEVGLTESSEVVTGKKPHPRSAKIDELKAKRDQLQDEVDQLAANVQAINATLAEGDRNIELGKRLKRHLQETTAAYQSYTRRYADSGSEQPLQLVGSPGDIKVIDPPMDPKFPDLSRKMYIIAGILAGLVLGSSAAIVAEVLDQRLRHPAEFVAILGAPVICRLPTSRGIDDSQSQKIEVTQTIPSVTQLMRSNLRAEKSPTPKVTA